MSAGLFGLTLRRSLGSQDPRTQAMRAGAAQPQCNLNYSGSRQASEGPHGVKRVPWGERMEGSKEQERRADHVQQSEQDLAGEVLSAVHAASRVGGRARCRAVRH